MPRYVVTIDGPELLSGSDVKGTLQQMLPSATGWEVEAASMQGTVYAAVSVFDAGMTEISRGVQELLPMSDGVTFITKHVHTTEEGQLVEYTTETRFTRTRLGAPHVEWSPVKQ